MHNGHSVMDGRKDMLICFPRACRVMCGDPPVVSPSVCYVRGRTNHGFFCVTKLPFVYGISVGEVKNSSETRICLRMVLTVGFGLDLILLLMKIGLVFIRLEDLIGKLGRFDFDFLLNFNWTRFRTYVPQLIIAYLVCISRRGLGLPEPVN